MNDEGKMWKEAVVTYFNVQYKNFFEGWEKPRRPSVSVVGRQTENRTPVLPNYKAGFLTTTPQRLVIDKQRSSNVALDTKTNLLR
jgi:hypothetical protein